MSNSGSGEVKFQDVKFVACETTGNGGALCISQTGGSSLVLDTVECDSCTADGNGGAIHYTRGHASATLTIVTSLTFKGC